MIPIKRVGVAVVLGAVVLLTACSGGGYGSVGAPNLTLANGNPGGSTPPAQKAASTALYQVNAGLLPYPFDVYFAGSTDGTLNIQPPNALEPNQAAVNALDGFSTTASIRERFNGPIDVASLATPGAVVMIHINTNNAGPQAKAPVKPAIVGGTGAFAPLVGCVVGGNCAGADYSVGAAADDPTILEITPLHPLAASTCLPTPPATTSPCAAANGGNGEAYLVLLSNAITVGGARAVPDADYARFLTALATDPSCGSITDPQLNPVCQLTGAHLGLAQLYARLAPGYNPANIVASFSFSTESTIDSLVLISATADPTHQTIKVNPTPFSTHTILPQLPGHANIYAGALSIPYYLSKAAPLTAPWQAPPVALVPGAPTSTNVTRFNPLPVPTNPHMLIPLLVTVPNAASAFVQNCTAHPPCPTSWPVLIFEHGITRSREDMLAVADSFADQGFVVAAIDVPSHGITDRNDPFYATDANPLYAGIIPPGTGSIERTFDLDLGTNDPSGNGVIPGSPPDGVIDPSGTYAINLAHPLVTRDGLRQAAADLTMLSRLLPSLSLGATGGINASEIHFLGHSVGGIVGAPFMAVVGPGVSTATLSSTGGDVAQIILQTSPSFAPRINAGLEAQGLFPGTTLYANFFRDIQTVWDAGDPVNYIALATAAHPIHMLQVIGGTPPPPNCAPVATPNGCPDQVVPNRATAALIAASAFGPAGAGGALTRIARPAAPGLLAPSANGFRAFVNFIQGDHSSLIDDVVPPVTAEMQGEAVSFALSGGHEILISVPTVIEP